MSGKNIGIKRFFKPVKIQPNKANDLREDGIEKIPQIQTKKVDSSKPYPKPRILDSLKLCFTTKNDSVSMND